MFLSWSFLSVASFVLDGKSELAQSLDNLLLVHSELEPVETRALAALPGSTHLRQFH